MYGECGEMGCYFAMMRVEKRRPSEWHDSGKVDLPELSKVLRHENEAGMNVCVHGRRFISTRYDLRLD